MNLINGTIDIQEKLKVVKIYVIIIIIIIYTYKAQKLCKYILLRCKSSWYAYNNNQLHEKMCFRFDLKISTDGDFLISNGNSFHSLGAAQANARSPSVIFVLHDGVCSKRVSWELRRL